VTKLIVDQAVETVLHLTVKQLISLPLGGAGSSDIGGHRLNVVVVGDPVT